MIATVTAFLREGGPYHYYFFVFFAKKKKATRSKFATVSDRHSPTSSFQYHASVAVTRTAETLNIKYSNTVVPYDPQCNAERNERHEPVFCRSHQQLPHFSMA
jgi:hypothetical protein